MNQSERAAKDRNDHDDTLHMYTRWTGGFTPSKRASLPQKGPAFPPSCISRTVSSFRDGNIRCMHHESHGRRPDLDTFPQPCVIVKSANATLNASPQSGIHTKAISTNPSSIPPLLFTVSTSIFRLCLSRKHYIAPLVLPISVCTFRHILQHGSWSTYPLGF